MEKILTIRSAEKYLFSLLPSEKTRIYPGRLGLARMKRLAGLLGNPQKSYPVIHIAGTSGKGSVATYVSNILSRKFTVGLHTSPHIEKINERIKVMPGSYRENYSKYENWKGENISNNSLLEVLNEVKKIIEKEDWVCGQPSYFEAILACAFLYFNKRKVDYVVLETGLGGRLDGTNIVDPLVSVITSIGFDHTQILGNSLVKIAKEKAGIIKKNSPAVIGRLPYEARIEVMRKSKQTGSPLYILGRDFNVGMKKVEQQGCLFDYSSEETIKDLKVSLSGVHQAENACLAIKVIELMKKTSDINLTEQDIRKGLENAYLPARMETLSAKPLVIIDGAHNEDKIKSVLGTVRTLYPRKRMIVLFTLKDDKSLEPIMKMIAEQAEILMFTSFKLRNDQGSVSSHDPDRLLKIIRKQKYKCRSEAIQNPAKGMQILLQKAGENDLILVIGSFYLISVLNRLLRKEFKDNI